MRTVKLTFITTIPDAETDDQAFIAADRQVAELDAPGDWVFDGMEIKQLRGQVIHRSLDNISIYEYDDEGNLIDHRQVAPHAKR